MKNSLSSYFFSSLVHRFPNPQLPEALQALPKKLGEFCQEIPETSIPPEEWLVGYTKVDHLIHPSWKEEIFSYMPEAVQKKKEPLKDIVPSVSLFLLDYAVTLSSFKDIPRPSQFAKSEISYLIQAKEEMIVSSIDLLSMFFVVEPFRLILDKQRFKRLSALLTPLQRKFLAYLLLNPRSIPFESLDLQKLLSYETVGAGKAVLFEKSISVFSQALYGENEDLISLVCYKLPMQLGKRVQEMCKKTTKESTRARAALKFVFEFLKSHANI